MRRARELDRRTRCPTPCAQSSRPRIATAGRIGPRAPGGVARSPLLDWSHALGQANEGDGERLALEALEDALGSSGGNSKTLSLRGYILGRMGARRPREVLAALEAASHERYVPPYAMALVHAGLGERDAMFAALEQAYARATSTSSTCRSTPNGTPIGPIRVSSIWLPAAGLGLPTDRSRREFSCGPDPSAVATSTAAPAGRRRCPAPSAPHVSRPDRTDSPVAFD